ncbi:MAG: hypothetical protein IPJ49_08935 [Candidatus Obscuribacter sp.]|nr:hypothetical protein [Candidatus Obscuribacter sp.]
MQTTDKMKTKSRVILAAAFTAVSLFSFVAGSIVISAINTNRDIPAAQAQVNQTDALVTYSIYDPTFKLVAGTYSHPAGWQADSQVKWDIEAFSQPLKLHSIAQSPDGLSALEFFPTEQFCWLVPNPGFKHPGLPMGDGATLLPPVSAVDAMVHFVIPKLRGNVPNLQILQVVPMPELSNSGTHASTRQHRRRCCSQTQLSTQWRARRRRNLRRQGGFSWRCHQFWWRWSNHSVQLGLPHPL